MPRTDSPTPLIPADRPPSAHCHTWRVRLPDGADAVRMARVLDDAARAWWGEAADRSPRLWAERVPAACDSPTAHRRLDSETHRSLRVEGPMLRAVLLQYADGPADLVLAAHRANLDALSLRQVADVLTGRAPHDRFTFDEAGHPPVADTETLKRWREADYSGRVEWAAGDDAAGDSTGTVTVAIRGSADARAAVAVAAGLVLGRYANQENPVLGALAPLPRAEGTLGAFETGVLLALDLSGMRSTNELVAEAARILDGHGGRCDSRHYAELCAEAGGRVVAGLLYDGLTAEGGAYLPCHTAPFPLTLAPVRTGDGGLRLEVRHRLAEVDEESARRFARHVARAYEQLVDAHDDLIPADVELLDEPERRQVVALGRPARPLDWRPERIDEVFAARAADRPDAVALTCEGRSLTYAELDERAGRYAAALRAEGVRAGERVGICLDRSLDLVVTMLAVLKADAVYVPMDPAYPADRLAFTAQDAALRVVVARADFPGGEHVRVVPPERLAAHDGSVNDGQASGSEGRRGPEGAAYVIYTSGSTGRPKGVVVPHRNVVALLSATRDDFALGPGDTWTLFHSSAFDFSVWEIWGPLLTGARLVVVPYWVSRSPEEFHQLLVREQVTVLNQTPSAFAQLMEADRRRAERLAVRLVVFGGEPLDARPLRDWLDRYPESRCRLVNMFGITETTVHVTAQTVTRREAMAGSRSVGHALPGWHLYVLDERGRPLPCGVPGEIYVGGEGVALEYLGRPELTAQRFVPDPFTGGRMYRSGDRGRLLPDGRLEHLGRLDTQVKIRGFRIELDEIRNVLLDDPSVTAAAVVLGGDPAGDAAGVRIDAYVVLDGVLDGGDTAAVRLRASKVLPEYMLPTTVTALAALPLTANGKLDVRELPAPAAGPVRTPARDVPAAQAPGSPGGGEEHAGLAGPEGREGPVGPEDRGNSAGDLAAVLAVVWESVLGVPVGLDDNFFELGGNSLYAMRMAASMRDRGLPALPMRELYLNPTVRGLAQVLDGGPAHE
ncbi:amino acid adenylation domain-containing protein [Nonomuraea sp. NPDC005983]|uniref:amino acid adenylation domain-containing protein n=1 Tax=Nonomuraea sp. NPDC005983 TaxID=3155595 RepID=UPI0033A1F7AA